MPNPSLPSYVYLAAIAAGTATACWVVRKEASRVRTAVEGGGVAPPIDGDTAAALRRINLRLVSGNES